MRILISSIIVFGLQSMAHGQWDGNSTPTYPEVINQCQTWANSHDEIELFQMGMSDYGKKIPIEKNLIKRKFLKLRRYPYLFFKDMIKKHLINQKK